MDPVTHALTSAALDRAGLRRVSRMALPILLASGLAPDLDWLSYFAGPSKYLRLHDTLFHSLLGCAILVVVIAFIFWFFARKYAKAPLKFRHVLLLSAIGAAAHLLLDLATTTGAQLLWPFRGRWFAFDWLSDIDLWILAILAVGLFLPGLFRLVTEEIGMRGDRNRPSNAAIVSLVLVAAYIGLRGGMHRAAVKTLLSQDYHGRVPLLAGAFPNPTSLFSWRGIVDTSSTIETIGVDTGPGASFYAETSLTHFKPVEPAPLAAARRAPLASRFLAYAQYPIAQVDDLGDGYRVTLRDMRFPSDSDDAGNLVAVITLDSRLVVRNEQIEFTSGAVRSGE